MKTFKSKKSQIAGQIFIYILTAVVIGIIVLIGYWAINKTVGSGCQVEQLNFKNSIETLADKYDTYGSLNKDTLSAPCGYEKICFVDNSMVSSKTPPALCTNSVIKDSVKSGTQKNIFIISKKDTVPVGFSDKVALDDTTNCTCISSRNNNFYLTFKGKGDRTVISATT